MPDRPDPAALLDLASSIALESARIIEDGLGRVRELVRTKSSLTDMVTEVDHASEGHIVRRILEARPGDGLLGEEGASRNGNTGIRWIIDPLDGTTNFLYGFPAFAVSIAVEVDGATVVGVVHDVARAETFAAYRGGGATCNGRPISVGRRADVTTSLLGTGFGYAAQRRRQQAAILGRILPKIRDIRRAGSAALDFCWVASGRLDGYFEQGIQTWDWTAGALIVEEAGGQVGWLERVETDPPGLLDPPPIIAANPTLYGGLVALLREAATP